MSGSSRSTTRRCSTRLALIRRASSPGKALKAAGEALTDAENGKYGIGLFAHLGEDTVVVMNSFVYSNGGSVLADDGSCALDEPEAVEALEYLRVAAALCARRRGQQGFGGHARTVPERLAGDRVVAGPGTADPLEQRSRLGLRERHRPRRQDPGRRRWAAGTSWSTRQSQHKEEAWQFIEFMTSPEINGQVVDLIPANIEAANAFLKENRKGPELILEHLNNARPRPLSPEYLQVSTIEQEMMQAIVTGTSVNDAVASACEQIDALAAE